MESVSPLEFSDQPFGNLGVGDVIGQDQFHQAEAFLVDDHVGAIAPEEDQVFLFAVDALAGVITQRGLAISSGRFMLVSRVAVGVFEIVFLGSGQDGFRIENELIEGGEAVFDQQGIQMGVDVLKDRVGQFLLEPIELGLVGKMFHLESAQVSQDAMGVEEFKQSQNGFDLFEMFDDQGAEHGMAGEAVASDAFIDVGQRRNIQGLKQGIVLPMEVGGLEEDLEVIKQGKLKSVHGKSSSVWV